MEKGDWGVVEFSVLTDKIHNLEAVATIALTYHHTITHYKVIDASTSDGSNHLRLYWGHVNGSHKLPFKITNAKKLASFLEQWLESEAVYGTPMGDCDVTEVEGVLLTSDDARDDPDRFKHGDSGYLVLKALPAWVEYHK